MGIRLIIFLIILQVTDLGKLPYMPKNKPFAIIIRDNILTNQKYMHEVKLK
jgi:hypothetical protein